MQEITSSNNKGFEIGIYTLGDITPDPYTGKSISSQQRLQEILKASVLADEAGLDIIGIGEHHRLDYAVSATAVVLSSIAQITKRIKLTSATTVLSTIDPVRLFEEFATLDLLSNGRAEIIAGRGAFLESFPLFGYDLDDYDELFNENYELFQQLSLNDKLSWQGQYRSPINDVDISPRPIQEKIPMWIGVGGTLESAERAGRLGTGMAMAILGGDPSRFKPLVEAYRSAGIRAGHNMNTLKVGVTGHCYISTTTQQAKDEYYPYYSNYRKYVDHQLGKDLTKISRAEFDQMANPDTALFVGSPQQVVEKILQQYELFGHQRFMAQLDIGGIPYDQVARNIEFLATEIAPRVRRAISQ
ncbi:LLM class flavin-dependent oxidoreductase [Paenibacillus crassostreae]|uniref:Luciferase n=1 Tax=Paenibacillus crassostreae TaxID=1763538 RepID=A0A167FF61_9BACL|nr:LLM class flavin-dependent oxidoreductase [Paenibacillus crassostreae]AOZ94469.1 luciferase [Paenibacillus crassostreae]OAB76493.1 luciferase [Paenibacillus crassostreae]